jgi:hypothetical protein
LVSHTKEGHRLKEFENRVIWRIFGPKMEKAVGGWRRLHNEGLNNLYASPSINVVIKLRRNKWAWNVVHIGVMCIQSFGWKSWREETTQKT